MQPLDPEPNGSETAGNGTTANEPRLSQALSVNPKRVLANRRNAQKSTGPRTAAGKEAAAANSTAHGIFASVAIIRTLETTREWNSYHAAMITDMAPLGMLEMTLAERVITSAWRLRRVLRYETDQVQLTLGGAAESVAIQVRRELEVAITRHNHEAESAVGLFEELLFTTFGENGDGPDDDDAVVPSDQPLHEDDAKEYLRQTHERLGRAADFEEYWGELQIPGAWTVGLVRQLIHELAEDHRIGLVAAQTAQSLAHYRANNLLPDDEAMEKVIRYEGHLSRQMHRDLHELQRLQAVRQGHRVPVPVAIDVDIATGPNHAPENGH